MSTQRKSANRRHQMFIGPTFRKLHGTRPLSPQELTAVIQPSSLMHASTQWTVTTVESKPTHDANDKNNTKCQLFSWMKCTNISK